MQKSYSQNAEIKRFLQLFQEFLKSHFAAIQKSSSSRIKFNYINPTY